MNENANKYLNFYRKNKKRIPPVLILHGPEGLGKNDSTTKFVKDILCESETACNHCLSCRIFDSSNHPDYIRFPADPNREIKIGDEKNPDDFTIRWLQRKRIIYQPYVCKLRMVHFPDANLINHESETALLKILEEPPSHTKFILVTNNLHEMKQTVISRSVLIPFSFINYERYRVVAEEFKIPNIIPFCGTIDPYKLTPDCRNRIADIIDKFKESTVKNKIIELESEITDTIEKYKAEASRKNMISFVLMLLIHHFYNKNNEVVMKLFQIKEKVNRNIKEIEDYVLAEIFWTMSE